MNTHALTKQYERLTPRERLPLILAASGRGDEVERDRLTRSAPRVLWRVTDYFGRALAFREVADIHFMEMLDLAALYLHSLVTADARDEAQANRLFDAALLLGYLVRTQADGWRRFCGEYQLDPDLCWSVLPGYRTVGRAEAVAQSAAFTEEGATRYLAREGKTEGQLVTIASIAAELRRCLESRAAWWG